MQGKLENDIKIQNAANELMKNMPDFVTEWFMNLKASNKTYASCYEYARQIRKFLEYISDDVKNMSAKEITLDACESYFISCLTTTNRSGMEVLTSNSYKQTVWSILNNFLKFLHKQGYIECNYMDYIERIKTDDSERLLNERVLLTQKDFNKILSAAKEENNFMNGILNNRDVLIILIFMTTGIRKSAMSSINIEDIDVQNKTLSILNNKFKITTYNLNEQTIDYYNKWLLDRQKLITNESGNALFVSKTGNRLGDDAIYNIVKKCCYKGIGKRLSPNKLRAGLCSILYKKTHDIEFVRKIAGHSTIQTTQRYFKTKDDEHEKAIKIISEILK